MFFFGEADLLQTGYEKRAKRKPSRTLAAGAERRFLAPAKRRNRDQEVEGIVALAQQGRFAPPLYPVAAAVGFGPEDLMRLPPEAAAGVAEAQETMAAGPPKLRRNLMSLIEACGIQDLLRRHPRDVLKVLGMAAAQASLLSFQRGIRCHEAAAGEALGWASAEVTAVEAQRAINTGSRAAATVMQAELTSVRLQTETARAEKAGVPSEALVDEERRGRKLSNELMSHWASQIDLSQPRGDCAADQRSDEDSDEPEGAQAANCHATPCTVSDGATGRSDQEVSEEGTASEGGTAWPDCRPPAGSSLGDETMMPAGSRRSDEDSDEAEGMADGDQAANRHATPYTVSGGDDASATGDADTPAALLPLPLAERRVDASETLRALGSPAAADDPADSWETEVLGIAVRTGKASASIVARFVEQASTVPIFPEPGTANQPRPPMHHYLERLSPRGWPRVTATGSSSISLMGAP
jgi:hypothetical protein